MGDLPSGGAPKPGIGPRPAGVRSGWSARRRPDLVPSSSGLTLVLCPQLLKPQLPAGLLHALDDVLNSPPLLLLSWLLRSASRQEGGAAEVLGAYVAVCLLPLPADEQQEAEQSLLEILVQMRCEDRHTQAQGAAVEQAARCAVFQLSLSGNGDQDAAARRRLQAEALACFTSAAALRECAEAQLLLARLPLFSSAEAALGIADGHCSTTAAQLSVLGMALLLPSWEAMVRALASGVDAQPFRAGVQPAGKAGAPLVAALCACLAAQPALVMAVDPPVLAHACRASLRVAASYAAALDILYEHGKAAPARLSGLLQSACVYQDHASQYLRGKLAAKLGV